MCDCSLNTIIWFIEMWCIQCHCTHFSLVPDDANCKLLTHCTIEQWLSSNVYYRLFKAKSIVISTPQCYYRYFKWCMCVCQPMTIASCSSLVLWDDCAIWKVLYCRGTICAKSFGEPYISAWALHYYVSDFYRNNFLGSTAWGIKMEMFGVDSPTYLCDSSKQQSEIIKPWGTGYSVAVIPVQWYI